MAGNWIRTGGWKVDWNWWLGCGLGLVIRKWIGTGCWKVDWD